MKFKLYSFALAVKAKQEYKKNKHRAVAYLDTNVLYQVIAPDVAEATTALQFKYGQEMFIPLTEERILKFMDNGGFQERDLIDLRF